MKKILIIDDEEFIRYALARILSQAGYEVFEASNGADALYMDVIPELDLVITDLLMPEQDGLGVIMEMKKKAPDTKLIAISGGGKTGNRDFLPTAAKLGAHATLSKPFESEELLEVIDTLIGK